jgi:preprotein translocase subunit YajC
MNLLFLLLQCQPSAGSTPSKGTGYETILMFALLIVVFYFFFIRPQTRKNKEMKKFRESIQKGDKVVTIGGIHGKINEVRETTFVLEMIDKTHIEIEKSAITNDPNAGREQMAQKS